MTELHPLTPICDDLASVYRLAGFHAWQLVRLARFKRRNEDGSTSFVDKQFWTMDMDETIDAAVCRFLIDYTEGRQADIERSVKDEFAQRHAPWNPELDNVSRMTLAEKRVVDEGRTYLLAVHNSPHAPQTDLHAADQRSIEDMQTITPNRPATTLVKPVRDHLALIVYTDGVRWRSITNDLRSEWMDRAKPQQVTIAAYCML